MRQVKSRFQSAAHGVLRMSEQALWRCRRSGERDSRRFGSSSPRSSPAPSKIDLRKAEDRAWLEPSRQDQLLQEKDKAVVIDHLEHNQDDPAFNRAKLRLLEQLIQDEKRTVILSFGGAFPAVAFPATPSDTPAMPDAQSTASPLDSVRTETTESVKLWRCESNRPRTERLDTLALEEPLEIRVRGRCVAVIMRTPGHDAELATGFLLTEGLIQSRAEVLEIAHCRQPEAAESENVLNVFLAPSVEVDFERLSRHVFTASSCGLCGKTSIESVHQHFPPISAAGNVSAATVSRLPDQLRAAQETFNRTGGLHASAVFTRSGKLVVLREDVGRHNAVDKVIGHGCLENQLPFDSHILLVSGRASFEIVQKALAARIPIVAAISAPSNLAVEFARESGQTLVGFLRGQNMNIYSGAARITSGESGNGDGKQ